MAIEYVGDQTFFHWPPKSKIGFLNGKSTKSIEYFVQSETFLKRQMSRDNGKQLLIVVLLPCYC